MGYGTDGLTFNALRGANLARLPEFRNKHGGLAHSKTDGSDWSPAQWLQALVGELGEYANIMKKVERGDLTKEEAAPLIADELADVQTYLDILAYQVGVDLGEATRAKFNRVSIRVRSRVRLGADDWYYAPQDADAGGPEIDPAHSEHCKARLLHGDGVCECGLEERLSHG